jgi:hypothetical protein
VEWSDGMNRKNRRQLKSDQHKHVAQFSKVLTLVPESEWPRHLSPRPFQVWRSTNYLVQLYEEPRPGMFVPQFRGLIRMSVNRAQMLTTGRWKDGLTWDELQAIKSEVGFGDWYGVEVYPRDADVINDANIRHIWLMPLPMLIGWRVASAQEVKSDAAQ